MISHLAKCEIIVLSEEIAMELIVELFRALANRERIRIVRLLVVLDEMNVTQISEATELDLTLISRHLKVLAAAGLVWRRRSGRRISYCIADRSGNPVTTAALRRIRQVFSKVNADKPRRVVGADQGSSATESDSSLFSLFTAFTHPRRLQIVRHLTVQGPTALRDLMSALSMSRAACFRHLAKLERRGLMASNRSGRRTVLACAQHGDRIHDVLFHAVRDYLAEPLNDLTLGQV